mmetsp:Transcript_903/g.2975  ORF Transcript_903/g.2975 Transcript_903/m.2975 type:complete len:222 (+) Transcript_903:119-784(+)
MTSLPATTAVTYSRAAFDRSSEHVLGAAKQWQMARVTFRVAAAASSSLAPSSSTAFRIPSLAAARTSASPRRRSIAMHAATPAPMLCPVSSSSNVGLFAIALAAGAICVCTTCHALATTPACAHPPQNGTDVQHASVSKSSSCAVPRIATTTVFAPRSMATYDAGENVSVLQFALTMSAGSIPALLAAAAVTSSPALLNPDMTSCFSPPTNPFCMITASAP